MLAAGALAVPESSVQMSSRAIMTIHYLASVFLDLEQKAWALVTCATSARCFVFGISLCREATLRQRELTATLNHRESGRYFAAALFLEQAGKLLRQLPASLNCLGQNGTKWPNKFAGSD
jgi:hypothetical protein